MAFELILVDQESIFSCRFSSVFRGNGFLSSMRLFVPAASYDTNKAWQQKLSKETLCQQHPQATMMGISGVKRTKVYTFSERATKGFSWNLISHCDPVWISFNLMYLARGRLLLILFQFQWSQWIRVRDWRLKWADLMLARHDLVNILRQYSESLEENTDSRKWLCTNLTVLIQRLEVQFIF